MRNGAAKQASAGKRGRELQRCDASLWSLLHATMLALTALRLLALLLRECS